MFSYFLVFTYRISSNCAAPQMKAALQKAPHHWHSDHNKIRPLITTAPQKMRGLLKT